MSSDELFLGNILVAVAEGDVRLTADKSAATVGVGEGRWAERDALPRRNASDKPVVWRVVVVSALQEKVKGHSADLIWKESWMQPVMPLVMCSTYGLKRTPQHLQGPKRVLKLLKRPLVVNGGMEPTSPSIHYLGKSPIFSPFSPSLARWRLRYFSHTPM